MDKIRSSRSSLQGNILIPASKSHTIRAVALATMASGTSLLKNPLDSDDARAAFRAAGEMGAMVEAGKDWTIRGIGGAPGPGCKFVDVGNSGTTLRIFTALCALGGHPVRFDGDSSIRGRLMEPLLSALEKLGAEVVDSASRKCPFTIKGPIKGGITTVNGISSQFLTALLLATPLAEGDSEILVENLNEKPYIEITLDWLRKMNIHFEQDGFGHFLVPGNQRYKSFERAIPGDFSSAAFSLCAAAVTQSEILIEGLDFSDHQGDKAVFSYFEEMGLKLKSTSSGVLVKGGPLEGITVDMNDTPDALPAMAVAGCFAKGQTRLLNVPQARLKECDRIAASTAELRKMGAEIDELEDGMVIHQSKLRGSEVHGYDDHRMVMALAVAGLAAEGETIVDTAGSVGVTYPGFINDMRNLGAKLEYVAG